MSGRGVALGLTLLALLVPSFARAADVRVLTAGAYRAVLNDLAPGIEAATGHRLIISNETTGVVVQKVKAGEAVDLVVLPPAAAAGLGTLLGPVTPLAKVGIGVAVARGAPRADITTEAGLRALALSSRAPSWIDPKAGGSSGISMAQLWERWGIAGQMLPKSVLVQGGLVADAVVSGRSDLAFQQISELMAVPGVDVLGPLPESVQSYTVYAAAVPASGIQRAAANQVIAYLAGPQAGAVLLKHGMQVP